MKRLLNILIALCMAFLFMPLSVHAETYISSEMQELIYLVRQALETDRKLVLEKDYTITASLPVTDVTGQFTLDLNGHVIRLDEDNAYQHSVISANIPKFILEDSRPEAQHTGAYAGLPAGGVITGSRADETVPGYSVGCGGVTAERLMIMNGGTIYDCRGALGGGVYASEFEMNGGIIANCHAKHLGGAVCISQNGTFIMNSGTIENCTSGNSENSSIYLRDGATMAVAGDVEINCIVSSEGKIRKSTEADNGPVFNDTVYNRGTVECGIYYGGIINEGRGSVSNTHNTVSFDVNGGTSSTPPTQWFVNVTGKQAKKPSDPVNGNYTFMGWYEGDTLYDFNSAVDHDIVLKAMWKDTGYPVITGIEDGKTYCDTVQFEVSDNISVSSVTVNDQPAIPDSNGKYTLIAGVGNVKAAVEDAEGNRTVVNVTVNAGHTYDWKTENGEYWKECIYCGDTLQQRYPVPVVTLIAPEELCRTQDAQISALIPENVISPSLSYEFERIGNSLDVTAEDGKLEGVLSSTAYPASENSFKAVVTVEVPETGYVYRTEKTVLIEEHTGGTATCITKAVCTRCGQEYGEIDPDNHISLSHFPAKAATVAAVGNIEYWQCDDCDENFSDAEGIHPIKLEETVVAKLKPSIIEGEKQTLVEGEKKDLTFRSNAEFADFIEVKIDGKTLDPKNYTAKEGSTIVTLKGDYVSTLSVGKHVIGIVSDGGTAETEFTITAKKVPDTSDSTNLWMWAGIGLIAIGTVITTAAFRRKEN
ncbi:MAG: InlB B-repeat-containing protein [Bulleidia sp.]